MSPLLSIGFLFWPSLIFLSIAESIQGDIFCSELMCVTAFVNSGTVVYQMTALNQLGWMAIGFGTQMADAKMVIMWQNTDGSITLSQRTAAGLVEPIPDPNPPHIATTYTPLSNLSSGSLPDLAFSVPKDDTIVQKALWALGIVNPVSISPNANLEMHLDSGNFTLNLTNRIDTESIPTGVSFPSSVIPTGFSEPSSSSLPAPSSRPLFDGCPFELFEKLIIAHAILLVIGFLFILPCGMLIARWGRTLTLNWFYYHWAMQAVLSIPIIVSGWALGPLSVAVQGRGHVNDSHKVLGILLFPLYLLQMSLGTFIYLRKPPYPKRHPPRNVLHGILGIMVMGFAFYEVRTGFAVDWPSATSRSTNLDIFSTLWIAWVVFIPAIYFTGFFLLPRQLAHERQLPPPYSPGSSEQEIDRGTNIRHILGLEPVDDGTHDIFSDEVSRRRASRGESSNDGSGSDGIEMREVSTEHRAPLSLTSSRLAPAV